MNHARLLDCTLRDGAYLVDKYFGEGVIRGIIKGLINSRIDIIEIGFLQDDGFGEGKTVFKNSSDAKKYIPYEKKDALFAVLADYSRYNIDNLDVCDHSSIDAVRECFFKNERFDALEYCKTIKKNGYLCFVQPVDILGYSDAELIELVSMVNEIEPYCFSIVDTFGSMYFEDLHRVFELINHNLIPTCKLGFHSHNNMQMSNALSQEFIRMTYGKRESIVDTTISGMGRGAGNTPTELVAQYMVSQLGYNYDIDSILDLIDDYMDGIKARCSWGYTTPLFVSGCYSSHVNNISYLSQKNSLHSKDIRHIISRLGIDQRKRYDYDLLEKTYIEYLTSNVDDAESIECLKKKLDGKKALIVAPGASLIKEEKSILDYINKNNPIIICINFIPKEINPDYIYVSNTRRYDYWKDDNLFKQLPKIITSNIKTTCEENEVIVSFNKLVKCGWNHIDNSTLMLLRLLDKFLLAEIAIAGFDGYSTDDQKNYVAEELELHNVRENPNYINVEIKSMLVDYLITRENVCPINLITSSRFSNVFK